LNRSALALTNSCLGELEQVLLFLLEGEVTMTRTVEIDVDPVALASKGMSIKANANNEVHMPTLLRVSVMTSANRWIGGWII
jgi:hypothetical protein